MKPLNYSGLIQSLERAGTAWCLLSAWVTLVAVGCDRGNAPPEPSIASSPKVPRQAPAPSAQLPAIKRDWRGIRLGSTEAELRAAALAIGFSVNCQAEKQLPVVLFDPVNRDFTHVRPPGVSCSIESPAMVEWHKRALHGRQSPEPGSGTHQVIAKLIQSRIYELRPSMPHAERMDAVALKMRETFGMPRWTGEVKEHSTNSLGPHVTRYRAITWEDDRTVVLLMEVDPSYSPDVTYLDLSRLPDIKPLVDAYLEEEITDSEKKHSRSTASF